MKRLRRVIIVAAVAWGSGLIAAATPAAADAAIPSSPSTESIKKPLLAGVDVKGCRSFRQTIADTPSEAFAFTVKAHCFSGKRLNLRYKQAAGPGDTRFWGRGRAFGHRVRLSGPVDSLYINVRVDGKDISRAGEGTLVSDQGLDHSKAWFTLGRTGYQCSRTGGSWQDWSLSLLTRGLQDSHYHGTASKAQRRGLPWALCAAMLTASENHLPTNW